MTVFQMNSRGCIILCSECFVQHIAHKHTRIWRHNDFCPLIGPTLHLCLPLSKKKKGNEEIWMRLRSWLCSILICYCVWLESWWLTALFFYRIFFFLFVNIPTCSSAFYRWYTSNNRTCNRQHIRKPKRESSCVKFTVPICF